MIRAVKELTKILVAIVVLGRVALGAAPSITQEEAEKFVKVFYQDLGQNDLEKVMAHFDQTVEYYSAGKKDRSLIAAEFGKFFVGYPSRSFTVSEIQLKPSSASDRVTVNFDLRSFLRNPERDANTSGHAKVEWDLIKRDGALKIVRFAGTAADGAK